MYKKIALLMCVLLSGCSYVSENKLILEGDMDCNMVTRVCTGENLKSTALRRMYFNCGQPNTVKYSYMLKDSVNNEEVVKK